MQDDHLGCLQIRQAGFANLSYPFNKFVDILHLWKTGRRSAASAIWNINHLLEDNPTAVETCINLFLVYDRHNYDGPSADPVRVNDSTPPHTNVNCSNVAASLEKMSLSSSNETHAHSQDEL